MTNHSEATGTPEDDDAMTAAGQPSVPRTASPNSAPHDHEARGGPRSPGGTDGSPVPVQHVDRYGCSTYEGHGPEHQVTLRTPAELADALPYLLGYRPEDSIVLVALHDVAGRGRFGGRARLGIPASAEDWNFAAQQLAQGLVTGSERRGGKPEQLVAFLCHEPAEGESGQQVMERLRPLAQKLRIACGDMDVPVIEALCISDGRFWSYCCDRAECCPPDGRPMGLPGTSVLAAAAAYAGVQVRGSLRELRARLMPLETSTVVGQRVALDNAGVALVPRILDDASRAGVGKETLELAERMLRRFAAAPPVAAICTSDLRDDGLLDQEEAARLILGLQDRSVRDRVAEWMEGDEAAPALRLWRALARRCVHPYTEHAAAPLTLAGWVAWSAGDGLEAREALAMALGADSEYLFARLLHQACNEGLDPESIRRCLRRERSGRVLTGESGIGTPGPDMPAVEPGGREAAHGCGRPGEPEHRAFDVTPAATSTPGGAAADGGAVRPGGDGDLPRSKPGPARAAGRRSGTKIPRPRVPAGVRPHGQRSSGVPSRTAKGTTTRGPGKGGTTRRNGAQRDGARSGDAGTGPGAEGDA
ncbi:hypothetical protein SZN_03804 [Streptomyces zinciresistens K42]|uniref:DUF4192 domain-containing protein n=1 Tax=Streptomyces zinciresistens K42 TaxID=700597 RepID=G2G5K7_9ACTN|nr:DUF4192 domain-containing protein [Streptomyces zinciresistens]EGX61174.1 hypothetical protein SZN_03804 [Streptomyces zinciresistens K42]